MVEETEKIFCPKGIWIPIEVLFNPELTPLERELFCFIDSLDSGKNHCFASNQYLAKILSVTETKISLGVTKLIRLQYINLVSFDGRQRVLKINQKYLEKYQYIREGYIDFIRELKKNFLKSNQENIPQNLKGSLKRMLKADLNGCLRQTLTDVKHINTIDYKKNRLKKKIISEDIIQKEILSPISFDSKEDKALNQKSSLSLKPKDNFSPEDFKGLWNSFNELPRCRGLNVKRNNRESTKTREQLIKTLLSEEPSKEYWENLFSKIITTPFLMGENDRGWKTDIDFVINPGNHIKILEGKYDLITGNGFNQKPIQSSFQKQPILEASQEEQEYVLKRFNHFCRNTEEGQCQEESSLAPYKSIEALKAKEKEKINRAVFLAKEVIKPGNIIIDSGSYKGSWEWKDPDRYIPDHNGRMYFDTEQEKIWVENKEIEYGASEQSRFGYDWKNVIEYLCQSLWYMILDNDGQQILGENNKEIYLGHLNSRWIWEEVLKDFVSVFWRAEDFEINKEFLDKHLPEKEKIDNV